jgi:uncharacterized membrane protein
LGVKVASLFLVIGLASLFFLTFELKTDNITVVLQVQEEDNEAPAAPELAVTTYQGTTVDTPQKTRTKLWTLRGGAGAAEPGATIIIYGTTYDPITLAEVETNIELDRGTVEEDGSYSVTIALDAYEGYVVELELVAVDVAGNMSERTLFGNFMYDATAPTVTIDPENKEITTTEASVTISGNISKNTWETFADLIVEVSPATAAISFDPDDGTFIVSVPLDEGTHIISVTAIDPVGNASSDYSTITRMVEPPVPTILPKITKPKEPISYVSYAVIIIVTSVAGIGGGIIAWKRGLLGKGSKLAPSKEPVPKRMLDRALLGYIAEHGGEISIPGASRALGVSQSEIRRALGRLKRAGKVAEE